MMVVNSEIREYIEVAKRHRESTATPTDEAVVTNSLRLLLWVLKKRSEGYKFQIVKDSRAYLPDLTDFMV